jgi:antitoxin VapB
MKNGGKVDQDTERENGVNLHSLAAAIALETGETRTRAVTEALRERYERLQSRRGRATVAELLAIAKRASSQVRGPYLTHDQFLYDERGLPR